MRWVISLYIEFVGKRQVQRSRRPSITGICDDRSAIEENAKVVMSLLDLSRMFGSSAYRLDPITIMVQNKNGDRL